MVKTDLSCFTVKHFSISDLLPRGNSVNLKKMKTNFAMEHYIQICRIAPWNKSLVRHQYLWKSLTRAFSQGRNIREHRVWSLTPGSDRRSRVAIHTKLKANFQSSPAQWVLEVQYMLFRRPMLVAPSNWCGRLKFSWFWDKNVLVHRWCMMCTVGAWSILPVHHSTENDYVASCPYNQSRHRRLRGQSWILLQGTLG